VHLDVILVFVFPLLGLKPCSFQIVSKTKEIMRNRLNHIRDRYNNVFKNLYDNINVGELPKKYRDYEGNFKRFANPVLKAHDDGYKTGLDFGCGVGGCCVVGSLLGLKMTGVDIPEAEGKPSPYLSLQHRMQKNYSIVLCDTTEYPWEFEDNQFDFIVLYFSLNKEFMHEDKLDFQKRLDELVRITRKGGAWYIWPTMHFNLMTRKQEDRTFNRDKKVKIIFGA